MHRLLNCSAKILRRLENFLLKFAELRAEFWSHTILRMLFL